MTIVLSINSCCTTFNEIYTMRIGPTIGLLTSTKGRSLKGNKLGERERSWRGSVWSWSLTNSIHFSIPGLLIVSHIRQMSSIPYEREGSFSFSTFLTHNPLYVTQYLYLISWSWFYYDIYSINGEVQYETESLCGSHILYLFLRMCLWGHYLQSHFVWNMLQWSLNDF